MKHFQYGVYLKRRGLYSQAVQKFLLQELKREQRRGIAKTDLDKIILLIDESKTLHMGQLLSLEVKKADAFVIRFQAKSTAVLIIQRSYRGLRGRRRLEARRQKLIESDEKRMNWEGAVAKACFGFVAGALSSAKKAAMKKVLKPVTGRFTTVMDDQTVVASVSSLRSVDYFARGKPPKTPCLSCLRLRPKMRYSVGRKTSAMTRRELHDAVERLREMAHAEFEAQGLDLETSMVEHLFGSC